MNRLCKVINKGRKHMLRCQMIVNNGDIKTFAMAGAWFGLAALPTLFAVFVFSITVHGALVQWKKRATRLLPSGPAHMLASLACMLYSQMR